MFRINGQCHCFPNQPILYVNPNLYCSYRVTDPDIGKMESAYHSLLDHDQRYEVPLPPSLRASCPNVNIYHFYANPQLGDTCGNHAVFNALALQELVEEQETVSSENVQARETRFFDRMHPQNYKLCDEDIVALGSELGLKNARVIDYDTDIQEFYTRAQINGENSYYPVEIDRLANLDQFYQNAGRSNALLAHFILNIGDHWVLVTIIKYMDTLSIIYQNSVNRPIEEGSVAYRFLVDLCQRVV